VDEAEDHAAFVVVEQAVVVTKASAEAANLLYEAFGGLPVVVDVDLDVTDLLPGHIGERFQQLGAVLLLRLKEAVARLPAVSVAGRSVGDTRPGLLPTGDALQSSLYGGAAAERLVVVGNGDPKPPGPRPTDQIADAVAEVGGKPYLGVTWQLHDQLFAPFNSDFGSF